MSAFLDVIDSTVPRMVRQALVADATLRSFFGTRIYDHDYQEAGGPLVPPYLAVIPESLVEKYFPGQKAQGLFKLLVTTYLPRQIPVDVALPIPAAPIPSASGSGPLTGAYTYAVSCFTDSGVSYASEPASIPLTANRVSLTLPTSDGYILWRGEAGRSYLRYLGVVKGPTFIDSRPDSSLGDDLAPDSFLGRRIRGAIKRALMAEETLTFSGIANADMVVSFADEGDSVATDRNCRVMVTGVTYQLYYDRLLRYSVLEIAP